MYVFLRLQLECLDEVQKIMKSRDIALTEFMASVMKAETASSVIGRDTCKNKENTSSTVFFSIKSKS